MQIFKTDEICLILPQLVLGNLISSAENQTVCILYIVADIHRLLGWIYRRVNINLYSAETETFVDRKDFRKADSVEKYRFTSKKKPVSVEE